MTREERSRVLGIVLDEVNSKAPVIAGVGTPSTRETIALGRDAKDIGADALIVVTPYYCRPSSKELLEHYSRVASSVDLPIIVYNVPKFTGYNVEADLITKIIENNVNVVAVKDSAGSIGQISELVRRVGIRVSVLAGTADVLLPSLHMGAKGGIIAIANVVPRLCVDLYNAFMQGDFDTAKAIQMRVLVLNDVLVRKFNQLAAIKQAMSILGKEAGRPRGPSLPLDTSARTEIEKELLALGIT
jgi:4-hydroxy-tetrahydrodipicolinate synthase